MIYNYNMIAILPWCLSQLQIRFLNRQMHHLELYHCRPLMFCGGCTPILVIPIASGLL
jgi:hypothetical protein